MGACSRCTPFRFSLWRHSVRAVLGDDTHWPLLLLKSSFGFGSVASVYYSLTCLSLGDAIVLSFTRYPTTAVCVCGSEVSLVV